MVPVLILHNGPRVTSNLKRKIHYNLTWARVPCWSIDQMKWFRVFVLQSLLYLGLTITHMQSSVKMEFRPAGQWPLSAAQLWKTSCCFSTSLSGHDGSLVQTLALGSPGRRKSAPHPEVGAQLNAYPSPLPPACRPCFPAWTDSALLTDAGNHTPLAEPRGTKWTRTDRLRTN